jgi:hypothetical protein
VSDSTASATATMPRHLLSIADLDADLIRTLLDTATQMHDVQRREVKKIPTLRGRTVINLFFEDSTRTRSSFEIAGKWMSADTINITGKGVHDQQGRVTARHRHDDRRDGVDALVMRHSASGACSPGRRWVDAQRHQRRRRNPRTPHAGAPRRLHDGTAHRRPRRQADSSSSGTSPTRGCSAPTSSAADPRGRRHRRRPADADAERDQGVVGCGRLRPLERPGPDPHRRPRPMRS